MHKPWLLVKFPNNCTTQLPQGFVHVQVMCAQLKKKQKSLPCFCFLIASSCYPHSASNFAADFLVVMGLKLGILRLVFRASHECKLSSMQAICVRIVYISFSLNYINIFCFSSWGYILISNHIGYFLLCFYVLSSDLWALKRTRIIRKLEDKTFIGSP